MLTFTGPSDINRFLNRRLRELPDLHGRTAVDIPAGTGRASRVLRDLGAEVRAFDLFPEFFDVEGLSCTQADLSAPLPIEDASADLVLFQEGIEHLPDQLLPLREMNRILRPGGRLLLTTPNVSHLRARMSHFLMESELYKRMPANELDAVWHADNGRTYFGHLFLIGIQRLRTLAVAAGFRLTRLHTVRASYGSLVLGVFHPLIALVSAYAYLRNLRRDDGLSRAEKRRVYGEMMRLNVHPTVLYGRHILAEFEKTDEADQIDLHVNSRVEAP
jgi:SAM-dependent methyltransferase